jgi:hypothetical protein
MGVSVVYSAAMLVSGEAAGLSATEAKGEPMEVYGDYGAADTVGSKLVTSLYAKLPNMEVSSDDS